MQVACLAFPCYIPYSELLPAFTSLQFSGQSLPGSFSIKLTLNSEWGLYETDERKRSYCRLKYGYGCWYFKKHWQGCQSLDQVLDQAAQGSIQRGPWGHQVFSSSALILASLKQEFKRNLWNCHSSFYVRLNNFFIELSATRTLEPE